MYMLYTANVDGDEVRQGYYVGLFESLREARHAAEERGADPDGLYNCFAVDMGMSLLLLRPNGGGWDYYATTFGLPMVLDADDILTAWDEFEESADEGMLERARGMARDGSSQAICDAYQALESPDPGYGSVFGSYGAGLSGLGYGLEDYGFGSGYTDYSDPF